MTDKRPEPLVPADVDLNGLGWMPMKHVRVMNSTLFAKSTGDEFKAAFALWMVSWTEVPAGSLPNDEDVLAAWSRAKSWEKVRTRALHGWIECSDGRLYHPVIAPLAIDAWARRDEFREKQENKDSRQERWRQRVRELSKQLRELGAVPPRNASLEKLERLLEEAKGARNPSTPASTSASQQASTSASTSASHVDAAETALTETVTEGETGTKGSSAASTDASTTPVVRAERGKRLPKDWALPKSWGDWALAEYPHWTAETVRRIALKFANHWQSATKNATKLDWEKTWQNWCMDERTQREHPAPRGSFVTPAVRADKNALAEQLVFGSQQGILDGSA